MYSEALVRKALWNKNGMQQLWLNMRGWEFQVWNIQSWASRTAWLTAAFQVGVRAFHPMTFLNTPRALLYMRYFWIRASCRLILISFKIRKNKCTEILRRFSSLPRKSHRFMPFPFQGLFSHIGLLVCCFNQLSQNRSKYLGFSLVQNVYIFARRA